MNNKEIMSKNIKYYLSRKHLNVKDFAKQLGFKYTTVLDWVNGNTYPRIDKIEKMAKYFGVNKSDLVEEHEDNSQDDIALTWEDLDVPMPYGGKIPDELKHTYAVLAQDYFKQHPEYLNKDKNGNNED